MLTALHASCRGDSLPRVTLRFSPYAWSKLVFFRDREDLDVLGFCLSSARDLLLVEDICLVRQFSSVGSVQVDDASLADYFDVCVDRGLAPERFGRICVHAHAGDASPPSVTDERTLAGAYGACDWAVMAIVPRRGRPVVRMHVRNPSRGWLRLPLEVDFGCPFPGSAPKGWESEYRHYVVGPTDRPRKPPHLKPALDPFDADWDDTPAHRDAPA